LCHTFGIKFDYGSLYKLKKKLVYTRVSQKVSALATVSIICVLFLAGIGVGQHLIGLSFPVNSQIYVQFLCYVKVKVKVKQSRYRPGVAQRVPGSSGSQIS